jgi:hypothetical protein
MISRRNFLKLAGLGTIAISAGYATGKISSYKKSDFFVVHGFIPANEDVITRLVKSFKTRVKSNAEPIIISDSKIGEVISQIHFEENNYSNAGKIIYRIKKLNKHIDSDIIISDGSNSVYSPFDFNYSFYELRKNIKNRKADIQITAEFKVENLISSIFNLNKKEVVIENEKGVVEKIPLDKNYKNIFIDGVQGKTGLRIENGIARVHSSSCKNGLCKHSIATESSNIIACAPNKVLIRIV